MTDELSAALDLAEAPQDARNVYDLIGSMEHELVRSLASPEAAAILARHYTTAIRFSPELRQCTPASLVGALLLSAQVRLEPGPLGHVYLVPMRNKGVYEVNWWLGYTGIVELGRRGGAVGLRSTVVWDDDDWSGIVNDSGKLKYRHAPAQSHGDSAERIGVLVEWKEAGVQQAVWCPPSRIDTALAASARKDNSRREEDWYWRKTGVRFARPWLPLTTELATADRADDGIVTGVDDGQPVIVEGSEARAPRRRQ